MAEITEAEYRADWEDVKGRLANLDGKVDQILQLTAAMAAVVVKVADEEEKKGEGEEEKHEEEKHEETKTEAPKGIRFI